ncbi:transketolase (plasmid) [Rhizobium leguminosarum bv. trifolii]|uniref:transketolase n=1 Tax=Rhizobium ruizarguesonis TaxID=2081791 RepID=UPI00102FED73|nr:transketolase [Rhizobium ruizarguesonis]MBY5886755.1 transketolase [Rhizobium leguminosarum]QIO49203.1 transketolase [Rhizobium leguminosarum bv. trifolii]QSZ05079.1 transketolase [Rhizobium ruizarguesonis]TAW39191.1 transketolase [Rhizobium ruizarguesonis]TAY08774.1 transketolase [Rhizobium ruizarguesonis]
MPDISQAPKTFPAPKDQRLRDLADCIRFLSMDAVQQAKSGHPGMPMGMADIAAVLFSEFLKFDAADPYWFDRDRFVISNGHGSMLLYSLLYLTGYKDMTIEEIKRFRQIDSRTAGHPEYRHATGIETTTGPLGQGIANSVGLALGERIMNASFGDNLVNHHTYVFLGDGCLMEGISHEAISLAGHLKLGKLIAFWDDNSISIDGATSLAESDDHPARFRAANWHVQQIDGHDTDAIRAAIIEAQKVTDRPSMIACKTIIGFGFPTRAGTQKAHSDAPGEDEIAGARKILGWTSPPFEIPEALLNDWRKIGAKGGPARMAWAVRVQTASPDKRDDFERRMNGELPSGWRAAIAAAKQELSGSEKDLATRQASGIVLNHLFDAVPELLGGSADLTPSNNTKAKNQVEIKPGEYGGSYLHYGVREHGMAATMNGLALHGGLIPYGGTFLTFSDYCRPAIRLAAIMEVRSIFVMTHDSIGLGEDGPTHQPIEHLSALRAIPRLAVYRPGDPIETAECWEAIMDAPRQAALIALSRQPMPLLRRDPSDENRSARGAYVLQEAEGGERQLTILASGSELHLAVEARSVLQDEGIRTAVVSMPCRLLFEKQDAAYKKSVLGGSRARVAVEAAVQDSWDRYLGLDGVFVGMHEFGASGKIDDVYKKFDITTDAVIRAGREVAGKQA